MSQEDELAKSKVDLYDKFKLEVPYNHYGTRGVVDFVGIDEFERGKWVSAIEFKSESAVRNATGANEIIRQFKRQIEYFHTRDEINRHVDRLEHYLEFYLTEYTLDHVLDNQILYTNTQNESGNIRVLLRHPSCTGPFLLFDEGVLYQPGHDPAIEAEGIDRENLITYEDIDS